jgi:hypothetical protein
MFVTSKAWLGALLGTEMGLYKALRSDFICWVPGTGYCISLVYRMVMKLMLDFTGFLDTRHPNEAGGAYWLLSIVTTPLVCFMSAWVYDKHYHGPSKLDGALLFTSIGALSGVWAATLAGYLMSIERTYLWTFVSLETSCECVARRFRENEGDDERRIQIFSYNEPMWASIRKKVQEWSLTNYPRWKAEQPAWLTPVLLATIPSDFIPKECLVYEPALLRRHKGVRGLDGDLDY